MQFFVLAVEQSWQIWKKRFAKSAALKMDRMQDFAVAAERT
jgi:hypothetical protein